MKKVGSVHLYDKRAEKGIIKDIVPIIHGGTGANTVEQAITKLGGINKDTIDMNNGVVGLDQNNFIKPELFNLDIYEKVNIEGLKQIGTDQIVEFHINDYNSFANYAVSCNLGTVSVNEDVITYTAPSTPVTDQLVINGKIRILSIYQSYIAAPNILSPSNNIIDIGPSISAISSVFKYNGSADIHERTQWELATDSDFTTIVKTLNNTVNLISWSINGLIVNTTYYLRVRYKGVSLGWSDWSSTIIMTTRAIFLPTNEIAKIVPTDTLVNYNNFSRNATSIAISEDKTTLVFGSEGTFYYYNYNYGQQVNHIHVYINNNGIWSYETTLIPTVVEAYSGFQTPSFSYSVDISGDGNVIVVSNNAYSFTGLQHTGHLHIFTKSGNTWVETNIFSSQFPYIQDLYGYNVKINNAGDRIILGIGAEFLDDTNVNVWKNVAAYIYSKDINGSWSLTDSVRPISSGTGDFVSANGYCSVDMTETIDRIVLSYNFSNNNSSYYGVVEIYQYDSGWYLEQTLVGDMSSIPNYGSDPLANFGGIVKLNNTGDRLFVSSFNSSTFQTYIHIYNRVGSTWTLDVILPAGIIMTAYNYLPTAGRSKHYMSINAAGTLLAVGNSGDLDPVNSFPKGSFSLFSKRGSTWTLETTITSQDILDNPNFIEFGYGWAVELSQDGGFCFVGHQGDNIESSRIPGAVYVFA